MKIGARFLDYSFFRPNLRILMFFMLILISFLRVFSSPRYSNTSYTNLLDCVCDFRLVYADAFVIVVFSISNLTHKFLKIFTWLRRICSYSASNTFLKLKELSSYRMYLTFACTLLIGKMALLRPRVQPWIFIIWSITYLRECEVRLNLSRLGWVAWLVLHHYHSARLPRSVILLTSRRHNCCPEVSGIRLGDRSVRWLHYIAPHCLTTKSKTEEMENETFNFRVLLYWPDMHY